MHWDCAIKFAISNGWIPRLLSPFCLAVPDPLDRFRIDHGVMFKRCESTWMYVGWAGFRFIEGPDAQVNDCRHAPWPDGEYAHFQYPIQSELVASVSIRQIRDYQERIRASQSNDIESYGDSFYGPPRIARLVTIEDVRAANVPPVISSWTGTPLVP